MTTTFLRLLLLTGALVPFGCHTAPTSPSSTTSNLNHVVLISLDDPTEAESCAEDCRTMLAAIPSVHTLWVGTPVDTGRAAVDDAYEVGLCVGFQTREDLQAYLEAPEHVRLVEIWGPKASGFRIFDVGKPGLDR